MKSICFVRSGCFVTHFFYLNKLLAENLSAVSSLTKGEVYLSQNLFSLPVSILFFPSGLLVYHAATPLISLYTDQLICAAVSGQFRLTLLEQNKTVETLIFLHFPKQGTDLI